MNMTTKLMLVMHCEDVSGISFMAGEQHSGGRGGQFIITRPLFWPCIGKRWNIEIKSKSCRFGEGNNVNITATVRTLPELQGYEDKKQLLLQLELRRALEVARTESKVSLRWLRCVGLEKGLDGTGCLEKGLVDGGESRRSETFPLALATTTLYYSALAFILLKLYLCYIFIVVTLRLRCMYYILVATSSIMSHGTW